MSAVEASAEAVGTDEAPVQGGARHVAAPGRAQRHEDDLDPLDDDPPPRDRSRAVAAALALPMPAVVAAVALALGVGGWWLWQRSAGEPGTLVTATAVSSGAPTAMSGAAPAGVTAPVADAAGPADPAGPAPSAMASVTVHVAGAVAAPGIVVVAPGARVVDAVAAAGGLADDADVTAINLARPVADGEMILVPLPGEEVPVALGGGPAPAAGGTDEGGPGLVDVNRATAAELDELPGIGPVLAERIVAWREDTGPFASVDDLVSVPGIGPATLEELRDSATV